MPVGIFIKLLLLKNTLAAAEVSISDLKNWVETSPEKVVVSTPICLIPVPAAFTINNSSVPSSTKSPYLD